MALVKCPECGRQVSEYADTCPNCGCPMDRDIGYDEAYDDYEEIDSGRSGRKKSGSGRSSRKTVKKSGGGNKTVRHKTVKKKTRIWPAVLIILLVMAIAAAAAYYFIFMDKEKADPNGAETTIVQTKQTTEETETMRETTRETQRETTEKQPTTKGGEPTTDPNDVPGGADA